MVKRRLSIKKLFIVTIGFILILYSIINTGNILIQKIKYELLKSNQIVLNDNEDIRYKIYIDPGHGGKDVGTISNDGNTYEKDIVLDISKIIVDKLSKYSNVDIVVSRFDDKYISLENRVKHANNVDADYFVSIHVNADPNSKSTYGVETYYSEKTIEGSSEIAKFVQNNMLKTLDTKDRGVKKSNFMVTKLTNMPAILVECGFLSNNSEKKKLSTHIYKSKIAEGVVNGLVEYIEQK